MNKFVSREPVNIEKEFYSVVPGELEVKVNGVYPVPAITSNRILVIKAIKCRLVLEDGTSYIGTADTPSNSGELTINSLCTRAKLEALRQMQNSLGIYPIMWVCPESNSNVLAGYTVFGLVEVEYSDKPSKFTVKSFPGNNFDYESEHESEVVTACEGELHRRLLSYTM